MTDNDIAIFLLLNDAIEARDADALCALWRRFANWHGMNPDFAIVLQEHQAQVDAGMTLFDRLRARLLEKRSQGVH